MYLRSILGVLLLLALAALPSPALAQVSEDEEEESGYGYVIAEISTWIAQPSGLGYGVASRHDPSSPLTTGIISPDIGTRSEQYTKIGYVMPGKMGTFLFSIYEHDEDDLSLTESSPGNFIFGETLSAPLFAGFAYDGRADFYDSTSSASLTDFRFDFVRRAFERPKVKADWFVGVRRVKHRRSQSARYTALVPALPAFLPPLGGPFPALDPLEDTGIMTSSYTGRGLEAGMNFEVPLLSNKLTLDAGFSVGLVRGDLDATYRSQTRYYVLNVQGVETLLFPPFPELSETRENPVGSGMQTPLAAETEQRTLQIGLAPQRVDTSSSIIETHVGIRWHAWKEFSLSLGFRSTRYTDIGLDVRPTTPVVTGDLRIDNGELTGVNLDGYTTQTRSATYEGVYAGLGYKF